MNGNGVVTDVYTYDAFGVLIDQLPVALNLQTPNNYLYSGEQWDPELGMYFLRARYLNPAAGRFWTMDPYQGQLSEPQSLHKYLYVHNDPVNYFDHSGYVRDGHHRIPQSKWKKWNFSEAALEFFDSEEAVVKVTGETHNFMRPHGTYNVMVEKQMKAFMKGGVDPRRMSTDDARRLLEFVEEDDFIKGFNKHAAKGPTATLKWFKDKGFKLLPENMQKKALKNALKTKTATKLGSAIGKKAVPMIGVGFTMMMAGQMKAEGATTREIQKAVLNDLFYNVPEVAEAGVDAAWNHAEFIAEGVRTGAFGYLDYDPEVDDYQGGGYSAADFYEAAQRRFDNGGRCLTAGDSIGGWSW